MGLVAGVGVTHAARRVADGGTPAGRARRWPGRRPSHGVPATAPTGSGGRSDILKACAVVCPQVSSPLHVCSGLSGQARCQAMSQAAFFLELQNMCCVVSKMFLVACDPLALCCAALGCLMGLRCKQREPKASKATPEPMGILGTSGGSAPAALRRDNRDSQGNLLFFVSPSSSQATTRAPTSRERHILATWQPPYRVVQVPSAPRVRVGRSATSEHRNIGVGGGLP